MRIDYRGKGLHDEMPRAKIIDLDTGKQITHCCMADSDTGDFVQYVVIDGVWQMDMVAKRIKTMRGNARLKIELLDMW